MTATLATRLQAAGDVHFATVDLAAAKLCSIALAMAKGERVRAGAVRDQETTMPRLETLRARVGATILDVMRPGWAEAVAPDKLELSDCNACVLGQLYGSFDTGAEKLFAMRKQTAKKGGFDPGIATATIDAGFYLPHSTQYSEGTNYDNLTAAWKREIAKRVRG